jgi:hypothetical protein
LEDFLNHVDIEKIDLALATFSLTYVGPKVFDQTIRTVIEKLNEGGMFVGAGYADDHPSIQREEWGKELKIRNPNSDFDGLNYLKFSKKLYEDKRPDSELHDDLGKAEEYLEKIGLREPGLMKTIKRTANRYFDALSRIYYDIKFKRTPSLQSVRHTLLTRRHVKNVVMPLAQFQRDLIMLLRDKKQEILNQLKEEFQDVVEIQFTDKVFIIKRKIKTTDTARDV